MSQNKKLDGYTSEVEKKKSPFWKIFFSIFTLTITFGFIVGISYTIKISLKQNEKTKTGELNTFKVENIYKGE